MGSELRPTLPSTAARLLHPLAYDCVSPGCCFSFLPSVWVQRHRWAVHNNDPSPATGFLNSKEQSPPLRARPSGDSFTTREIKDRLSPIGSIARHELTGRLGA